MKNKLSLLQYLKTDNSKITIDEGEYHFTVNIEDDHIENVIKFENIQGLKEVVSFLNTNEFIFNINKPFKINKSNEFINITFSGFFSGTNTLQYDINNNKYKLIIHSYVIAIDPELSTESEFNLLCYKISSSNKITNQFAVQYKNVNFLDLKKFINEQSRPFSLLKETDIDLFKIVSY